MLEKAHPQLSMNFAPTIAQIDNFRTTSVQIVAASKKPSPVVPPVAEV